MTITTMRHIFQQGTDASAPTLLLLHGTGGTEHDLLALGQHISPTSSLLSVRGNVLEGRMPRFFRRLAEGVFDMEDLIARTEELYHFIDAAAAHYSFDRSNVIAVGYSNGANIAGSLLFHYADALQGAILHHPMVPRRDIALPSLAGVPIFIGAGTNDPICTQAESRELIALLTSAGAEVTEHWEQAGHQLTRTEADAAAKWFQHYQA